MIPSSLLSEEPYQELPGESKLLYGHLLGLLRLSAQDTTGRWKANGRPCVSLSRASAGRLLHCQREKAAGLFAALERCGLLNEPDILILDEPTAGLDPKERVHFRNILEGYAQQKIVLLSTHIVSDLEAIAHEVFLMKDGRFQTQGTVSELLQQANGRVWELTVPSREAETWHARMTVANLRYAGDSVTLRILSDAKPAPAARPCIPTLEDLYLLYFPEEEGGDNP